MERLADMGSSPDVTKMDDLLLELFPMPNETLPGAEDDVPLDVWIAQFDPFATPPHEPLAINEATIEELPDSETTALVLGSSASYNPINLPKILPAGPVEVPARKRKPLYQPFRIAASYN
jgi:hypothetical protein